jgi:periplasmic glucans biosynthesis protein
VVEFADRRRIKAPKGEPMQEHDRDKKHDRTGQAVPPWRATRLKKKTVEAPVPRDGRAPTTVRGGRLGPSLLLPALLGLMLVGPTAHAFGFDDMVAQAQALSAKSYQPPPSTPDFLRDLTYDQFRAIRFDPAHGLWRGQDSRFQVMLVAPGRSFDHTVRINVVDSRGVHALPFHKEWFDFGGEDLAKRIPPDLGYAGFKLTFPINRPGVEDQFLVFAGASYFRGTAKGENFGISSRGAAIDTGLASGEEFPYFTEYWLVRPRPSETRMRFYALLDSKRLSGAYQFAVAPGQPTTLEVHAVLFTRGKIELPGIAPLTSMFYYGENTHRPTGNWRPEVHDSDGLLIHNGTGEWLWNPLLNPKSLLVQSFSVENVRGFGVLQRDRRFDAYEDAESHYEQRPSAWVQTKGDWGPGRIVLVEIPTPDETNDNIVAFWSPPGAVDGGQRLSFEYELRFGGKGITDEGLGQVRDTFVGRGDLSGGGNAKDSYRFIVDFAGGPLDKLSPSTAVTGIPTAMEGGEILEHYVEYVESAHVWRLSMLVRPAKDKPLSLRAFLRNGRDTLTETWTYLLPKENTVGGRSP